jgi:CCR4-NOT transcription complex subunit 6
VKTNGTSKDNKDKDAASTSSPDSPSTKPVKAPQHLATVDTEEWVKIAETTGEDPTLYPDATCVGHRILLLAESVSVEDGSVLMSRTVKTELCLASPPPPPKRQLVMAKNIGGSGHRFRVVTYNMLAEIYATAQMYPYCDFWALSWDYRFQNLKLELEQTDGDVVCLQEVQSDYFTSHIQPFMSSQGYEGIYKQKTRDAMGMAGKVDGCAMFWRKSKLQCVENYSVR